MANEKSKFEPVNGTPSKSGRPKGSLHKHPRRPHRNCAGSPAPDNRAAKAKEALRHRRDGRAYRDIAMVMGISVSTAHELVAEVFREAASLAEDVLTLELHRLDAAQVAVWPGVIRGDLHSVIALLAIMDHRARLLGLYKTTSEARSQPQNKALSNVAALENLALKLIEARERYATDDGVIGERHSQTKSAAEQQSSSTQGEPDGGPNSSDTKH